MKFVRCKRCDAEDLMWSQTTLGKWVLKDKNGEQHHCNDGKIKAIKCKYCNANDLYWAEELDPYTQHKKAILTESYGLPHACDERIALIAKEKQDKKDKYEAEKKRVTNIPNGPCEKCKGAGSVCLDEHLPVIICPSCKGMGQFNARTKKTMLAYSRSAIWPGMQS